MVLNYYDKLGSYTEESLANFRTNKLEAEATSLRSMINIFEGVGGMKIHSTYDYSEEEASEKINLDMIRQYLEKGIPVMVAWNDWGGHWQTIIGYDDLGTETTQDDVIIVADSYDTTDHNTRWIWKSFLLNAFIITGQCMISLKKTITLMKEIICLSQ